TSSIDEARIDLYDDSPITQRSASTRFDLPQPFGPTTPVSPGSMRKSVGSTNDLKPISRSRVSFIPGRFQSCRPESSGGFGRSSTVGAENESAARRQQHA